MPDGTLVHVETARPCRIADHVTVGHGAILHACTVESGCLIGMGAIILSGASIGRGSVIAAGALGRGKARGEPLSPMIRACSLPWTFITAALPTDFVRPKATRSV